MGQRLGEQLAHERETRIDMPFGEHYEDRVFVWEVLVERTD
jgi:hypothetical protein